MNKAVSLLLSIFYILLIGIAIFLLIRYSSNEVWIFTFFAFALLIILIGLIMKETVINSSIGSGLYLVFHLMAFILIITGILLISKESTVYWWLWSLIGTALIMTIISNVIFAYSNSIIFPLILSLSSFFIYIIVIVFLSVYFPQYWYTYIVFVFAILFGLAATIAEIYSDKSSTININCINNSESVSCISDIKSTVTFK